MGVGVRQHKNYCGGGTSKLFAIEIMQTWGGGGDLKAFCNKNYANMGGGGGGGGAPSTCVTLEVDNGKGL